MAKEWKIDSLELKVINWCRSGDINTQEQVRDVLRHLIQRCGTQAKTAKALKIRRRTVTYRLNHAKIIHLEDALKMIAILRSKQSETEIQNDYSQLLQTFKKDAALNAMEKRTKEPIVHCIEEILQNFFMNEEKTYDVALS